MLLLAVTFTGCRQNPAKEPPRYYQRELARMKKEELRIAKEKSEQTYMSDRYPWRGTKSESYLRCVPCRINIEDKYLTRELNCLTECVHGKRKCRIKFRD